jgi:hypothetical protein
VAFRSFFDPRPFADPEAAARKLMGIANDIEPVQDGRIFIELINGSLFEHKGSPAEYGAGLLKLAIDRGWLRLHESEATGSSPNSAPIVRLKAKPQGYDAPRLFPGPNKELGA